MAILKDPLGLKALKAAVAALGEEAGRQPAAPGDSWHELVSRLDAAHEVFALKMDLLRDRYGLLKQSSAQLADELAWLRDQLDDLASAETVAQEPSTAAKTERRYTDRWKGRRP